MISVEGLVIPNKPLTNLEILDAVRKLKIPRFRGVFLRDNLLLEPKRIECGWRFGLVVTRWLRST